MPSLPESQFITANNLTFHVQDWSRPGEQVIMLHGLASNCNIWNLVAPILSNRYHILTIDQRGHGLSEKPEHGYDFATVTTDLHEIIKGLGIERPLIVGHSWGADVALEFAVKYPTVARGLCFVDGGMIQPTARYNNLEEARENMAPPNFLGVSIDSFRERVRSRNSNLGLGPESDIVSLSNFEILSDNTIRPRLTRENHLRIIDALWDHEPPELYTKVNCPVLMLPARRLGNPESLDRDTRRLDSVNRAINLLPTGKAVWLENSIHDVPIQRPELVLDTLESHISNGYFG